MSGLTGRRYAVARAGIAYVWQYTSRSNNPKIFWERDTCWGQWGWMLQSCRTLVALWWHFTFKGFKYLKNMDVFCEKSVKYQTNYFHLPFIFSPLWLLPQQILKGDISLRPRKWPVWLPGLRWTMVCSSSLPSVLLPFLSLRSFSVSPSVGSSSQPIVPWTTAFPVRSPPTPDHQVPLWPVDKSGLLHLYIAVPLSVK